MDPNDPKKSKELHKLREAWLKNPERDSVKPENTNVLCHHRHTLVMAVEDKKFRPSDTGGAIRKQRIHLYCGEGSRAEQMTFQITDHNNRPGDT